MFVKKSKVAAADDNDDEEEEESSYAVSKVSVSDKPKSISTSVALSSKSSGSKQLDKRRGPASSKRKAEKTAESKDPTKKKKAIDDSKLLEENSDEVTGDDSLLSLTYEKEAETEESNYSVAIPIGEDFDSSDLNLDTSDLNLDTSDDLPSWDSQEDELEKDTNSYASLLDSINNQLKSFSEERQQVTYFISPTLDLFSVCFRTKKRLKDLNKTKSY